MRYVAIGILSGWMAGFIVALVMVGSAVLAVKGICKLINLIRSATR